MLGCAHAKNSPERPWPTDGGATSCPDDWEMRHLYAVEVTPRPERITGLLESKTVVYIDGADDGGLRIQGKNLRGAWADEVGLWRRWRIAWEESLRYAVRIGPARIIAALRSVMEAR